jgi:hypothetical protein
MRPCFFLSLAAFCLLALGFRTSADRARAQASPSTVAATARVSYPTWEVKRLGSDPDHAREEALAGACVEVANYVRQNVPAMGDWNPSPDYLLSKRVISPIGEPEPTGAGGPIIGILEAKVKVELTRQVVQEMVGEARTERMHDRQLLLARLLAGAVAVLLVTAGYLRLEDATRGYYTTLLRIGAAGVVAVVGAGLWLLA